MSFMKNMNNNCSSGTLTNVLPHRNALPQTQDVAPQPVPVYRLRADLSLCYLLMGNITLKYTTTHINVLGLTRSGNPSPTFHTHHQSLTLNFMMLIWWLSVRGSVESAPYPPSLGPGTCGLRIHYAIRSPTVKYNVDANLDASDNVISSNES